MENSEERSEFNRNETFTGVTLLKQREMDFKEQRKQRYSPLNLCIALIFLISFISFIIACTALSKATKNEGNESNGTVASQLFSSMTVNEEGRISTDTSISRIAFGSCTAYDNDEQSVWTKGVIPSNPDAWIWAGDFVYMDDSLVDCSAHPDIAECNCEIGPVAYPPYFCQTGNLTHAWLKVHLQLMNDNYNRFLQYMCPSFDDDFALPPIGPLCPKPIIGTYDDHDSGWNNGNRFFPQKNAFKNQFLDGIGEPQDSIRRIGTNGIFYKYTLNAGGPIEQTVDVFLLDERYDRDPLPCGIRKEWCEGVLKNESKAENKSSDYVWCDDFLNTGGLYGSGSCCPIDDKWANGWCKDNADAQDDPLWNVACNPLSDEFGTMQVEVDEKTNRLIPKKTFDNLEEVSYISTFCDVLGIKQRKWLQNGLQKSKAPLKLVVSGSVPFGSPIPFDSLKPCSGDDFECYKVAQTNFAHIIGNVSEGCVVVLTGDFHVSDIKMLQPDTEKEYGDFYPTGSFSKPIYQHMSSGLTKSTAKISNKDYCKEWRKDDVGLRPLGQCSIVVEPAFGMVDIDWTKKTVSLQHRSAETGEIAISNDGSRQEIVFDMNSCQRIET